MENKKLFFGVVGAAVIIVVVVSVVYYNKSKMNNGGGGGVTTIPTPTPISGPTSTYNTTPLKQEDVKEIMPTTLFADKNEQITYLIKLDGRTPEEGTQYTLRYSNKQSLKTTLNFLTSGLKNEGYEIGKVNEQKDLAAFQATKSGKGSVAITIMPEADGSRVEASIVLK